MVTATLVLYVGTHCLLPGPQSRDLRPKTPVQWMIATMLQRNVRLISRTGRLAIQRRRVVMAIGGSRTAGVAMMSGIRRSILIHFGESIVIN